MKSTPLIIGRERGPEVLPYLLMPRRKRSSRSLYVGYRTIYLWTPDGWIRIPRGYVTDFGSIPGFATLLTCLRLSPLGAGALAFLNHDWPYAVGQEGMRGRADDWLRYRLEVEGVDRFDRGVIVGMVQRFGGGGYRKAKGWWDTENFADPETGLYPAPAPFAREDAFDGGRFGLRAEPDWSEERLAA